MNLVKNKNKEQVIYYSLFINPHPPLSHIKTKISATFLYITALGAEEPIQGPSSCKFLTSYCLKTGFTAGPLLLVFQYPERIKTEEKKLELS